MNEDEKRKKLIEDLEGVRETSIFNIDKLIEMVTGESGKDWYCLGRPREEDGNTVTDCIYAYESFRNNGPIKGCTGDCFFYNKLFKTPNS